jgi:hypothetical protein
MGSYDTPRPRTIPSPSGDRETISSYFDDTALMRPCVLAAYPCSISGYQTFTIATKTGSSATTSAPLWIFMHGGGVGFFDATGTPLSDATQMTEEPAINQRSNLLSTTGLVSRVRSDPAGYRMLAVS